MKRGLDMARSYSDHESSQENGPESPNSPTFNAVISYQSPKRSRRSTEKRVVNIPMKEVEGSRHKGDTTPPSDSWSWRKYGQKPIKGSPYPRGYYRCSSTKGCPARKQVERSRDDPTMILITYTSEHNHPWPLASSSRNASKPKPEPKPEPGVLEVEPEEDDNNNNNNNNNNKFMVLGREVETVPSCVVDEFAWFSEMETTSSTILESPIFSAEKKTAAAATADDVAVFFPMGEEDESLFADLGELPECSAVFSHRSRVVGSQVEIF